ncbi:pyrroline-5-carboxylate reductase family protein [Rhodoligotrophos defluvii]|uniref:pyrroline-5-carboxylate reductase family protein n=1 Tax=Rhodoligotrophos defluvii TaxID=2561934 RepID=UPI0010C9F708|nr:NAD(P)-binding domain-containing protein [Rhodoligotrophos defluvii]
MAGTSSVLGFIGVGVFAAYTIKALRRSGMDGRIVLSPRGRDMAAELGANWGCEIAGDNQAVADAADMVIVAVKPKDVDTALAGLRFHSAQTVVSGVAGVSLARLKSLMPEAGAIVRIMPAAFVETGLGLFPIYPANEAVEQLFAPAGTVVSFDTEEQFGTALLGACLSGWTYRFCEELVRAFRAYGISEEQARLLVLGNVRGTVNYVMETPTRSLREFSDMIAAEGTYTKAGLDVLMAADPMAGWRAALETVQTLRRKNEG